MVNAQVFRRNVQVKSEHGLHIRPCTVLAQTAAKFQCRVRIGAGNRMVDAKSILDLMTLAAAAGTDLVVETEGSDAAAAIEQIVALFNGNFAAPAPSANGQPGNTEPASISTT